MPIGNELRNTSYSVAGIGCALLFGSEHGDRALHHFELCLQFDAARRELFG